MAQDSPDQAHFSVPSNTPVKSSYHKGSQAEGPCWSTGVQSSHKIPYFNFPSSEKVDKTTALLQRKEQVLTEKKNKINC